MRVLIALVVGASLAACKPATHRVEDATKRAASWASTVKVVTEQWAQSRVSLRFVRTTLNAATTALYRDAQSIRPLDADAAARIDRVKQAIDPVMDAVALNEPDRARDFAMPLTSIIEPEPVTPSARPQ